MSNLLVNPFDEGGTDAPFYGLYADTSYDQPRTSDTVTSDIASERQAIDNSGQGDVWGEWFRGLAGVAVVQSLKNQNVAQNPALVTVRPGAPVLPQNQPVNQGNLLLIGAAIIAAVVLSK